MSAATDKPPTWRRWLRFRLLTLLIVGPLLAFGTAALLRYWYNEYQLRLTIKAVEDLGGIVVRDDAQAIVSVELPGSGINDDTLADLIPLLARLPDLRSLGLAQSEVTDRGLQRLVDLPRLEIVYLAQTSVTADGIAQLQRAMPRLKIDVKTPNPRATGLLLRPVYKHALLDVERSPEGHIAVSSASGKLLVFDADHNRLLWQQLAHDEWTFDLEFHPIRPWLATAGGDNLIKLWDWDTGRAIGELSGHDDDVHALAFSADGRLLISAGDDCTVRIWDVPSRTLRHTLYGHEGTIPGVAVSPRGTLAASASRDHTIRLWDIARGEVAGVLAGHSDDVMSVAFHPHKHELASTGYDGTVILWDLDSKRPVRKFVRQPDKVFSIRYSGDGQRLLTTGGDGARLWNAADGSLLWHSRQQANVSRGAWLTAEVIATTSADGSVVLHDARLGGTVARLWTRFFDVAGDSIGPAAPLSRYARN